MSKFHYASDYGMLYRFTNKKWIAFCRAPDGANIGDYGTYMGRIDNVTDWTSEQFADAAETDTSR